jgi:hypothetical protein
MLEAQAYPMSAFVTLTYKNEELPSDGSVVPAHLTNYIKYLRILSDRSVRYFGVGEYGDIGGRPHYHVAVFGFTLFDEQLLVDAWAKKGGVHVGELTNDSAQYLAGYVCKKWTRADEAKLNGRAPEFARMSRRPGIGGVAIAHAADALSTRGGSEAILEMGDVPSEIRTGGRVFGMGRYLRGKLRQAYGWSELEPVGARQRRLAESAALSPEERLSREKSRLNQYNRAIQRHKLARSKKSL